MSVIIKSSLSWWRRTGANYVHALATHKLSRIAFQALFYSRNKTCGLAVISSSKAFLYFNTQNRNMGPAAKLSPTIPNCPYKRLSISVCPSACLAGSLAMSFSFGQKAASDSVASAWIFFHLLNVPSCLAVAPTVHSFERFWLQKLLFQQRLLLYKTVENSR